MARYWDMQARGNGRAEILIYQPIGEDFWGDGKTVSAGQFAKDLKSLGAVRSIELRVNSPGGNVFDGQAIYSQLSQHKARVTVYIDGIAASIASVIAMAGDEILMPENAMMMIHDPTGVLAGTSEEFRQYADTLDKVKSSIISAYRARTGKPDDELWQLMKDETWMTGSEAVDAGFADRVLPAVNVAALSKHDFSNFHNPPKIEGDNMETDSQDSANNQNAAHDNLARDIRNCVSVAGLEDSFADELINNCANIGQAREKIFDVLINKSGKPGSGTHIDVTRDEMDTQHEGIVDALTARLSRKQPSDIGREFYGMSIVDIARVSLESAGKRTTAMRKHQLIDAALKITNTGASQDLPALLEESGQRTLREAYSYYEDGIRRISRRNLATDFRPINRLQRGRAPTLKKVNPGGEFEYGYIGESKEIYKLDTFGRIFPLLRQQLVNDDLGAFTDFLNDMARAASEFENDQLVKLLVSNPAMQDGNNLFDGIHGNVGTGAEITIDSLSEGRSGMRLQRGVDEETGRLRPLNIMPRYLLVPAALETRAEQYLTQIEANTNDTVNPFGGNRLQLVVDPRLDQDDPEAWYLAADPERIDTIEYSHLQEEPGPYLDTKLGFNVDGIEMKVRLDFGSGVLDWRGLWRNPGASAG